LILLFGQQIVHARRLRILRADDEQLAAGDVERADVLAGGFVFRGDALEPGLIEQSRQFTRDGSGA
jgi:hypothetical protein